MARSASLTGNQYVYYLDTHNGVLRPLTECAILESRPLGRESRALCGIALGTQEKIPRSGSITHVARQYLNLTAGAWRQLRRNWRLGVTPILLWQTLGPGSV